MSVTLPPLIDALTGRSGEPGIENEDASPRLGPFHRPQQGRIVAQPKPLAKPVDAVLGLTVSVQRMPLSMRPFSLVVVIMVVSAFRRLRAGLLRAAAAHN